MTYLIDTDWAVDYLKGIDEKVEFLQQEEELYVSTLTVGELVEGIEDSERKEERIEKGEELSYLLNRLDVEAEDLIEEMSREEFRDLFAINL